MKIMGSYKNILFSIGLVLLFSSLDIHSQANEISISDPDIQNAISTLPDDIKESILKESEDFSDQDLIITDTLRVYEPEKEETSLKQRFGLSYFNKPPSTKSPISDLPIKSSFIFSEGDKIEILINGSSQYDGIYEKTLSLDGTISFKEFGKVSLSGLTYDEAEQKLKTFLKKYILFNEIYLTVTELSVVEISIAGSVSKPGTYRLNPLTSILGALEYAGGVSEVGSLRKIKLVSNNSIEYFDLYDLFINGKPLKNRALKSGDLIFVEEKNNIIDIEGAVIRPGLYETNNENSFQDLIEMALGFEQIADLKNTYVELYSGSFLDAADISTENINLIKSLFIPKKAKKVNKSLSIHGPIETKKSRSNFPNLLRTLIDENFNNSEVYPYFSIFISRSLFEGSSSFNLTFFSLSDDKTYREIKIGQEGGYLIFFEKSDFKNLESSMPELPQEIKSLVIKAVKDFSVSLNGNFYNEGLSFPLYGNLSLPEFIEYVGGVRNNVEKENIQFVDQNNNTSFKVSLNENTVYFANGNGSLNAATGKRDLITVQISGEVIYPGTYQMLPGDTLKDLYAKAGGFTVEASEESILFQRESIKTKEKKAIQKTRSDLFEAILNNTVNPSISTQQPQNNPQLVELYMLAGSLDPVGRLVGDLAVNSHTTKTLKLEDQDTIFVPTNPSSVNIVGEVHSPLTVTYDLEYDEVSFYIESAGGLTDFSDKNSIYIIRSDGTSIPYQNGFF